METRQFNDKYRRFPLVLVLLLTLVLGPVGVQAQGPGTDPRQDTKDAQVEVSSPEVGVAGGIGNPPPAGFTILYMFTGVANETDNGRDESTSINCTNFHPSTTVEVRVEVYNQDPTAVYAANQTIASGATRTWSTQSIQAYNDGAILPAVPFIFQGSGRCPVKQHSQVICSAQVLDADVDPPIYAVKLPIYDRYGRPAHALRRIYLPLIRRK